MLFFGRDLIARIFLEHDALAGHHREEPAIFLEPLTLVLKRFGQNLIDIVLVRLQERSDLERWMAAEISNVFTCERGMGCLLYTSRCV